MATVTILLGFSLFFNYKKVLGGEKGRTLVFVYFPFEIKAIFCGGIFENCV